MARSIYEWAQARLLAHRYLKSPSDVDGVWGPSSTAALKRFQSWAGITPSGTLTDVTISELRRDPKSGVTSSVNPTEGMPPWAHEMYRRKGLHEQRDNRTLIEWLKAGRFLGDPAKLPWCGDAIETCIVKTLPGEPVPNNPFWAQSWAKFGIDAGGPRIFSIGVIKWSASSGHVGLVAGISGDHILLLGGNQSNAINIRAFPKAKFISFRWPATYPIRAYPPLQGSAPSADHAGTR